MFQVVKSIYTDISYTGSDNKRSVSGFKRPVWMGTRTSMMNSSWVTMFHMWNLVLSCICHPQSLDCDNPRIVLCKPWIRPTVCMENPRISQVLTHELLPVWCVYANSKVVHHEALEKWMKISFLSTKKVRSKLLTREPVCFKSMYCSKTFVGSPYHNEI